MLYFAAFSEHGGAQCRDEESRGAHEGSQLDISAFDVVAIPVLKKKSQLLEGTVKPIQTRELCINNANDVFVNGIYAPSPTHVTIHVMYRCTLPSISTPMCTYLQSTQ